MVAGAVATAACGSWPSGPGCSPGPPRPVRPDPVRTDPVELDDDDRRPSHRPHRRGPSRRAPSRPKSPWPADPAASSIGCGGGGPTTRPGCVRPYWPCCSAPRCSPLGPGRLGLGELLLLGRGAGRFQELEGVLLRIVGRFELHHRRQTPGIAVGDGDLGRLFGLNAWSILVPRPSRAWRRWLLYAAVRRSFRPGAALLAGLVLATTPVAALDIPVQQPRRASRAPAHRGDLCHGASPRTRQHVVVGPGHRARSARDSSRRCCKPSSSSPPSASST